MADTGIVDLDDSEVEAAPKAAPAAKVQAAPTQAVPDLSEDEVEAAPDVTHVTHVTSAPLRPEVQSAIASVPRPAAPQMQTQPLIEKQPGATYKAAAEQDTPEVRLGKMVPEAAVPALSAIDTKVSQPLERMGQAGGAFAKDIATQAAGGAEVLAHPAETLNAAMPSPYGQKPAMQAPEERAQQEHPVAVGVAQAIAGVIGSTAGDPRNWPFFLSGGAEARPILSKLISGGFAAQMGVGVQEGVQNLHDNWDQMTPVQRAEAATSTGLTALMAASSAVHAVASEPGHQVSKGIAGNPSSKEAPQRSPESAVQQPLQQQAVAGAAPESAPALDLSPDEVEVANAVRPGNAQVQAPPVDQQRGAGQGPQAGDRNHVVGEGKGGAGQAGVPAEAGRPVPRVKSTKIADARKIDQLRKGKVLAVDTQHEGPQTLKAWTKGMDFVPNPEGGRVIFDPKKTTREKVQGAISRGELYKLTGDQPPEAKVAEVKADLKPESTVPVPVEPDEPEGRTVPGAGAGEAEQLRGGVPEGRASGSDQPQRAEEVRDTGVERADSRTEDLPGNADRGSKAPVSGDGVIFARHGETKLDKEGAKDTVAGWTAEPLDERGRKSAAELADNLKEHQPTKIVTSDLERAKETAEIAGAKLNIPVEEDSRLRPQRTPETEGKQMGEAKPIHDHYVDNPDERPPGGETFNEAKQRQGAAIEEAQTDGGKPVILTHSRNIEAETGEPAPEPGGIVAPDRRQDIAQRKRVGEMSPEEMQKELLTSPTTGLPNRRAFEESGKSGAVGMSDADGLKALNDKFGYQAGNSLLKAKAEALREAGLDAYHDKGDEFLYRGKDQAELQSKLEKAREILRNRVIDATMADGTVRSFKGADFSHGTADDIAGAETALKSHKSEREASGERARGELRGITEVGPGTSEADQRETKYEHGSTQSNISADSEAAKALDTARQRISPGDVAGKGTDIGGNHVTVRYGIKGDDTAGIKKYLSSLEPFEATLGKTETFPPSEHSDGAAVIIAPIESPELHRINRELEGHGDFTEPSFDEYRPHATVAYVKPEAADRYIGMTATDGKAFKVNSIAITDRNGGQEEVKLEGEKGAVKPRSAPPASAAEQSFISDVKKRAAGLRETIAKLEKETSAPAAYFQDSKKNARERQERTQRINQLNDAREELRDIQQAHKYDLAHAVEPPSAVSPEGKNFEGRYLKAAIQSSREAWQEKMPPEMYAKAAKGKQTGTLTPPKGKETLLIKVPGDGAFLIPNTPVALEHAFKAADRFPPEKPDVLNPPKEPAIRSPKAFDTEKYIVGLEKEVSSLQDQIAKAGDMQRPYLKDQLTAAYENLADAKRATPEDLTYVASGDHPPSTTDITERIAARSSERGSAATDLLTLPVTLPFHAARWANAFYDRLIDAGLEKVGLGKPRPEIRETDPSLADAVLRMDGGLKYHREEMKQINQQIAGDLSREQEKGFVLLADKTTRDWLNENRHSEFLGYMDDPAIQQAITRYRPYEEAMRDAVKELGGKTIDEDYLHRAYDQYTEGIKSGPEEAKKGQSHPGGSWDEYITPQSDRMKGRQASAEYYYQNGLHEFGPSFGPRWMAVMSKLDEHQAAVEFYSKATRMDAGDRAPDSIYYNGKEFFSPEMAKQIREARPGSAEAKALASMLGIAELPKPKDVQTYAVTSPFKGMRRENIAAGLAKAIMGGADEEQAKGMAAKLLSSYKTAYAGPSDIVDVFEHAHRDALPNVFQRLMGKMAPLTKFIRQQVIGFGLGIPHYENILRRVANVVSATGTVADPSTWPTMWRVLFSDELKQRALNSTSDPAFAAMLRHSGISVEGAENFDRYVQANISDPKSWANAFRVGGREGGRVNLGSVLAAPFKVAAEAARIPAEVGHKLLFKPGGIDQRARLAVFDYLRAQKPEASEAELTHAVNDALGRYNRTSWTDMQRTLGPLMLFPGWDYSSLAYVLRHPVRTAVPAAVVTWLMNRALHALGKNSSEDKNDPFYVHAGKWSFMTNLLREPVSSHLTGAPLRAAKALADGKGLGGAAAEAAGGLGQDAAGLGVSMASPLVQAPLDLAYNRQRPGSSQEIYKTGDKKRRALGFRGGKAVEDYADFAARKVSPIYERSRDAGQGGFKPESLLSNVGITAFKRKKLH